MSDNERDDRKPKSAKTPLVLVKPPKKIGEMTDEELRAFATEIAHKIHKPAWRRIDRSVPRASSECIGTITTRPPLERSLT